MTVKEAVKTNGMEAVGRLGRQRDRVVRASNLNPEVTRPSPTLNTQLELFLGRP